MEGIAGDTGNGFPFLVLRLRVGFDIHATERQVATRPFGKALGVYPDDCKNRCVCDRFGAGDHGVLGYMCMLLKSGVELGLAPC